MNTTTETRTEILRILRQKETATAKDLSAALNITLSAVRQQLAIMEGEGLVIAEREIGKPGRPTHHYRLTDKADSHFTKNYVDLSLELIDSLIESAGKSGLKRFLLKRKERFIAKHREALYKKSQAESVVRCVANTQDRSGYMAKVKVEEKLNIIEEYNCPFIEVARKYPEFCEMERASYEEIFGRKVELDGCRARGANVCRFCISE